MQVDLEATDDPYTLTQSLRVGTCKLSRSVPVELPTQLSSAVLALVAGWR